jgi:DNA polymerase I-like protein with 3'-5' exonuclease and polymerase domains
MALSLGGFLVHDARRQALAGEIAARCHAIRDDLARRTHPLDLFGQGKKKGETGIGLSAPRVAAYFYNTLGCKPYYRKGTGGQTADEEAIRRLMGKYPKAVPVGERILQWRMWQKRGDCVDPKRLDPDTRFRALYTPTAVSGRLQSMENPLGFGGNGQNIPRGPLIRSIFVPDPGHVLIGWDLSRAEDRHVGGMSGDRAMMREAHAGPEIDTYMDVARSLHLETMVPHEFVRPTGKRVKLAAGYGMQGDTMSKAALLETEGALLLDPKQCNTWLAELYRIRPGIPQYQAWIRDELIHQGWLENSWGRRLYVRKLRLTESDYRDAYAWRPQSEVGVLMNQYGFIPLAQAITRNRWDARIVQQGHDSLEVSCHPSIAWEVSQWVGTSLSQLRSYPGAAGPWTLAMPVGYKLGPDWGHQHEWKQRPTRGEWDEVLDGVVRDVWWQD